MEKVEVDKAELVKVLEDNRSKHQAIFDEATEGYAAEALRILNRHIEKVKAGKVDVIYVSLPKPENHVKDYDRALRMVTMSVASTITLSEKDFQSYVMDDWMWKHQFLTSNSTYSGTAQASLADL